MKCLIFGASGLVGSHLFREGLNRGHLMTGTYRTNPEPSLIPLDLNDLEAVYRLIDEVRPDWVAHAAGWTWVDGCESDPARAKRENCEQPVALARFCSTRNIRFTYFSTTYVFDGKTGPYDEAALPSPLNVYGRSKWNAEQQILHSAPDALILRLICVWGRERKRKNFVYQVLARLAQGECLKIPSDQRGNPTWAGDVAAWTTDLMETGRSGVWNLAGDQENCLREEWVREIWRGARGHFSSDQIDRARLEPVPTVLSAAAAPRPLHAGAVTAKVQNFAPRKTLRPDQLLDAFGDELAVLASGL